MPLLSVSQEHNLYQEIETQLVSPYSKVKETFIVGLYRIIIKTGFLENTKKKPIVVFFTQDGKEVPKKDWTHEMKNAAKQYEKEYPVPNAGKKYSLLGKIWFSVAILGLIAAFAAIFYGIVFKAPQLEKDRKEFAKLPVVGDCYYGNIGKSNPFEIKYGWIKIIAVNPVDSICTYVTSSKISNDINFETKNEEFNNFSNVELKGKFKSSPEKLKISIYSSDKNTYFKSSVLNDAVKNYKIPAN